MVETPVLYITFARPEYASQSFAAIKKAQPKKLYFYSNKARDERSDEVARNLEVRSYIEQIDWDCDVKTWFRDEYVDVFTSIWGAIDWIFENEEKAIVIEEDVVACTAFWGYMEAMLKEYEKKTDVWLISSNNIKPKYSPKTYTHFATRTASIYGWGSWKDRWDKLDREMERWPEFRKSKDFKNICLNVISYFISKKHLDIVYKNKATYNPWDYIFNYNMKMNNGYCIMPCENLAADTGVVGANHSHAMISPLSKITYSQDSYPVDKGQKVLKVTSYDSKVFWHYTFPNILKRKWYSLLKK